MAYILNPTTRQLRGKTIARMEWFWSTDDAGQKFRDVDRILFTDGTWITPNAAKTEVDVGIRFALFTPQPSPTGA